MLDVKDEEYLAEVRSKADALGKEARAELEKSLSYLEHYRNDTCVCELYRDFAPLSFRFFLYGPEDQHGLRKKWFDGGVIYYAGKESGAQAPQLSVSLDTSGKTRWEVHT